MEIGSLEEWLFSPGQFLGVSEGRLHFSVAEVASTIFEFRIPSRIIIASGFEGAPGSLQP